MSASTPQQTQPRPPRPMWMFALFALAVIVALFNIVAFLYGLTLPSDWKVEESIEIDAPPDDVRAYVAFPRRWTEWSSWSEARDPTADFRYDGPESGEGASFSWSGEQLGVGTLTITEVTANGLEYRLEFQGETFSEDGKISFQPTDRGTRVVWNDGGEVSGTIGRFFRARLETSVAADFHASLARLKRLVESSHPAKAPLQSADGEGSGRK